MTSDSRRTVLPDDPIAAAFVPFGREEIEQSIPSRFEQQARRYADRLAVKTSAHSFTYDALNREANRLAHALLARDRHGRTPIVLLVEQSAPLIVAFLGILKAGKICVVLDPAAPIPRLAQLVDEARPTSIVTNGTHLDVAVTLAVDGCAVVDLDALLPDLSDANPGVPSAPDDLATILYTSGSTGQPKGVLGDHRNNLHCTAIYTNTFRVCADDRVTLLAFGTAQANKNLFLALLTGASLFPFDVRRDGLDELAALLRREAITITVMGASLFRSFVDVLDPAATFPALRLIRLGSEPVRPHDVELYRRHFSSRCLLVNGLAAGEMQTIRFFTMDHRTEISGSVVPVGYPVDDKTILLLDADGREVPAGEIGEIVVQSSYLSPGYWRRPDLTDAAFRPGETPGGPRRYFTGDLGRMDADGCLVCLGRKNSRVKIRGHGVDLLEIETALGAVDGVKDSVVIAHQNRAGYAYLAAYVVPETLPGPTNTTLRRALAAALPDFMIPSTFVVLGALPKTTSGKVDRQALPAPGRPYRDPSRPTTLPRTSTEAAIASIWADVMGHEPIDVNDHFYDLGGESLQALRIMARIRKTFDVDVDLQSLLEAPTVAELAQAVAELAAKPDHQERGDSGWDTSQAWSYLVQFQPGHGGRPVFFVPGGIGGEGELFVHARLARHVGAPYPFYGFKARSAEGREPAQASVEEMASDYLREIRCRQPEGPYVILGDCAGGIVAYEIAQQLRAQGQAIALLLLMDTPRPGGAFEVPRRSLHSYVEGLGYHREQLRALTGKDKLDYLLERGRRRWLELRTFLGLPPVQRSYSRAIRRYRPRAYAGKMTLLVNDELYRRSQPPHLGWSDLVTEGLEIHKVPGDHTSYIRGHIEVTAMTIRECLEKAAAAEPHRPRPDGHRL